MVCSFLSLYDLTSTPLIYPSIIHPSLCLVVSLFPLSLRFSVPSDPAVPSVSLCLCVCPLCLLLSPLSPTPSISLLVVDVQRVDGDPDPNPHADDHSPHEQRGEAGGRGHDYPARNEQTGRRGDRLGAAVAVAAGRLGRGGAGRRGGEHTVRLDTARQYSTTCTQHILVHEHIIRVVATAHRAFGSHTPDGPRDDGPDDGDDVHDTQDQLRLLVWRREREKRGREG